MPARGSTSFLPISKCAAMLNDLLSHDRGRPTLPYGATRFRTPAQSNVCRRLTSCRCAVGVAIGGIVGAMQSLTRVFPPEALRQIVTVLGWPWGRRFGAWRRAWCELVPTPPETFQAERKRANLEMVDSNAARAGDLRACRTSASGAVSGGSADYPAFP